MPYSLHLYCCARRGIDDERLKNNLVRSPEIEDGRVPVNVLWDQWSASHAFFEAMEQATADILIFAHCDVYFPNGWFERLAREVKRLSSLDPNWAIAGISSITPSGEQVGRVFDTALEPLFSATSGVFGKALRGPVPIVSTDELVLIVRREAGPLFDPALPEFHLYGTDIVLEAEKRRMRSYGLDIPLIHNAKAQLRLGADYGRAFRYMVRKWWCRLPVRTTCVALTKSPLTLPIARIRLRYIEICKPWAYSKHTIPDVRAKAVELGLDRLLAEPIINVSDG